jgi:hypothetical protein
LGEQPRQHELGGLGRMARQAQVQVLVHRAVNVRQLDGEVMNGCA